MSATAGDLQTTALHADHVRLGAKLVDFHGWEMPLYYRGIIEEHQAVRDHVGIFDISHMGQVLLSGAGAVVTLQQLVTIDVAKLQDGQAGYALLLNHEGGIRDDIIVYRLTAERWLIIINCGNREQDVAWLQSHLAPRATLAHVSAGRSIVAVQGPRAAEVIRELAGETAAGVGRFRIRVLPGRQEGWLSRTGYTGSDGYEFFVRDADAVELWRKALDADYRVQPAGLGARDTLRLEACYRLYGNDMDETTTPFEAGLGWVVDLTKPDFIGKTAIVQRQEPARRLVAFELSDAAIPRSGYAISLSGRPLGAVTSGSFSPALRKGIGLGYVPSAAATPGTEVEVEIRGRRHAAVIVKGPFYRQ
ncbi:MAG: glycine cleavage system aminomethyltransferase GcvT [Candidatus Omnitrophica bacterium]|nr:glycine cleavage system aminomethyltransferase GcvT [Candidatus Omnitrophota bacterium]